MTERVACKACGESIVQSTADANEGLCVPCKRGYRHRIEEGKRRREEEKRYRESPAWKHWLHLVEKATPPDGFSRLSAPEQRFFAVRVLIGEVYNGGFDQYFYNSAADTYVQALEGLQELGLTDSLRILRAAKEAMFGADRVVPDTVSRRALLRMKATTPAAKPVQQTLDRLDKECWADPDKLDELLEEYANNHRLRAGF